MGDGSLIWVDDDAWRRPCFGLPARTPLPVGFRSEAMQQLDKLEERRQTQQQVEHGRMVAHVQQLREGDLVAKWGDLVLKYGSDVVTKIMRGVDPRFELPVALRPSPKPQRLPFESEG